MKVIDLLNKIANGEDVPNKIKYYGYVWEFLNNGVYSSYWFNDIELQDYLDGNILENLNDEVEIIEEDKEIEYLRNQDFYIKKVGDKVNELIKAVNELKKGK